MSGKSGGAFDGGVGPLSSMFSDVQSTNGNSLHDSIKIVNGGLAEAIHVEAELLFTGDYSRDGDHLIISQNGESLVIENYFGSDTGGNLTAPNGAFLPFDVVSALAGPASPGQYAQSDEIAAGLIKIGEVVKLTGTASNKQLDGVEGQLEVGAPVYQGDVINTGADSDLGISFTDGTVFTMSGNAKMVLNELIYNPNNEAENSMVFNLVQGSFVFATGAIAPSGGMKIETPVATMGIRGTTPSLKINTELGLVEFTILPDLTAEGGVETVGRYDLYDKVSGELIGTVESTGTKWLVTTLSKEAVEIGKSGLDLLEDKAALDEIRDVYASAFGEKAAVDSSNSFSQVAFNATASSNEGDGSLGDDSGGLGDEGGQGGLDTGDKDDPPIAGDDLFETDEETVLAGVNVISADGGGPDVDPDGFALKVTQVNGNDLAFTPTITATIIPLPSGAILVISQTGGISYNANDAFDFLSLNDQTTDSFTYTIADPNGFTDTATVTITITGRNDTPEFTSIATTKLSDSFVEADNTTGDTVTTRTVMGSATFLDIDTKDSLTTSQGSTGVTWTKFDATTESIAPVGSFQLLLSETGVPAGTESDLVLNPDGTVASTPGPVTGDVKWTYTVQENEIDFLGEGETLEQVLTIIVTDNSGVGAGDATNETDTNTIDVMVTITGTNDTPTIVAATTDAEGEVTEIVDNSTAPAELTTDLVDMGTITFNDVDLTDTHLASIVVDATTTATGATVTDGAGLLPTGVTSLGVLTLDPVNDGTDTVKWTFTVSDADVDFLAEGESITQEFTITIDDQNTANPTVTQVVTIVINGTSSTNDAPTIESLAADHAGAVTEIADNATAPDPELTSDLMDMGTITFADVDLTDTHTALVTGRSVTDGGSLLPTGVTELGALTLDPVNDATDTVKWTFTVNDSAVDFLAEGESIEQEFIVTINDGNTATPTVTQVVTIVINGTNDAAIIAVKPVAPEGAVVEDVTDPTLTDMGSIGFTDVDLTDTHTVSAVFKESDHPSGLATQLGSISTVTVSPDTTGTGLGGEIDWIYTVANSAVQFLAEGQTVTETHTITLDDANTGGMVTRDIEVTITGVNDAAIIAVKPVAPEGAVVEDVTDPTLTDMGSIGFTDVDLTDTHTVSAAFKSSDHPSGSATQLGSISTVTVSPDTTGTGLGGEIDWIYTVANSAVQFLAEGQTVTETHTITLDDANTGGMVTRDIEVTITGINDAPDVLNPPITVGVTEDGSSSTVDPLSNASDVDGDALFISNVDVTLPAGVTYSGNNPTVPEPAGFTLTNTNNITLSGAQIEVGGDTSDNPDVTGGNAGTLLAYTASGDFWAAPTQSPVYGVHNLNDGDVGTGVPSDGLYAIADDTGNPITLDFGGATIVGSIAIYHGYDHRDNGSYTLKDGAGNVLGSWDVTGATGVSTNDGVHSFWLTLDNPVSTDSLVLEYSSTEVTAFGEASFREIQVFAPTVQEFSLDPSDASFQDLADGATRDVTVAYDVNDGIDTTPNSITWTVTGVNDAPVLSGGLAATVDQSATVAITTTDLNFTDVDDGAADVTFTVTSETNGSVLVNGVAATSFTGTQLAADEISFQQDGSSGTTASFDVSVEDGNEDSSVPVAQTFNVTVNPAAAGEFVPVGSEIHVDAALGATFEGSHSITQLDNGGYAVAWHSNDGDDDVFIRVVDASGNVVVNGAQVNTVNSFGSQFDPSITTVSGGFVVTYTSDNGNDVFFQRYDNAGAKLGGEIQSNDFATGDASHFDIAGLSGGGFVATWETTVQDGNGTAVAARVYDATGNPITPAGNPTGASFVVNTTTTGNQSDPSVTALSTGGFGITWRGADGNPYYQQFDASGGASLLVTELQLSTSGAGLSAPSITELTGGDLLAVWEDNSGADGSGAGIRAVIFPNGPPASIGTEFTINTTTAGSQTEPSVTALADGGFFVVWDSADSNGTGVFGQQFAANGDPVGSEILINENETGDQFTNRDNGGEVVTQLDNGNIAVTYTNGTDVFARILEPSDAHLESLKLTAFDAAAGNEFGKQVSINDNGVLVVGVENDDDNGLNAGAAYVYVPNGTGGFKDAIKLTASDGAADDLFGRAVSINNTGTVVVGAHFDDDNGTSSGSIYVYKPDASGVYTELVKLTPPDGVAFDVFGELLAINDSGLILVASVLDDDNSFTNSGSVYLYTPDALGGYSNAPLKLTAPDGAADDNFGRSVDINSSGTAVVGASHDDETFTNSGSMYFFASDGAGGFNAPIRFSGGDPNTNAQFGHAVAINDNGIIVVGAPGDDANGAFSGAIYIFKPDIAGGLDLIGKFSPSASDGAPGDNFGISVAINANGEIVVGADLDDDIVAGADSGSVYVYQPGALGDYSGTPVKITPPDGAAGDNFGTSVSISDDGTIVVGANLDDTNPVDAGSVYIFTPDGAGGYDTTPNAAPVVTVAQASLGLTTVAASPPDGPSQLVPAGADSAPAAEMQTIQPFLDPLNIASQAAGASAAVVSDVLATHTILHDAAGLNDSTYGNPSSWVPNDDGAGTTDWLKIELAQSEIIDTVLLGHDRTNNFGGRDPGQIKIFVAASDDVYASGNTNNDTVEYNLVFDSLTDVSYVNQDDTLSVKFDPIEARYVKIEFSARDVSIDEVQIHKAVTGGGVLIYEHNTGNSTILSAGAQVIDSAITVTDADDTMLVGATVSITQNFDAGGDILGFVNQNSISGAYDETTGILTLTGVDTVANYQTALQSVSFINNSSNPVTADREISFVANDGTDDSVVATSTVVVPDLTIVADGGDNILTGTIAGDTLMGLAGNDILIGGEGIDMLTGGLGADQFVLLDDTDGTLEVDQILDFNTSEDILNIEELVSVGFDPTMPGNEITFEQPGGAGTDMVMSVDGLAVASLAGISFGNTVDVIFDSSMEAIQVQVMMGGGIS